MNSLETVEKGTNSIIYNEFVNLYLFGCDKGKVEVCD